MANASRRFSASAERASWCSTPAAAPACARAAAQTYARRLVGVDLSPGMLEKARLTGLYDEPRRAS
ncbi:MAG: hypothetical protein U1E35_03280 [Rhodospirillales bacterium]